MKTIKTITSVVLSLIFCFGFAVTSFADTILSTQQATLSKIAPEIMQAFEDGAKKVPVYIWLTDINQDSVEKEVEQKTGLTRDTLSVNTETISAELAMAITSESTRGFSEKTTTEFNSYLERTAQARELERINTDTYISERRAIARSKIEAKNTAFVSSAEISESSIIFQSAYAPMIIAELSEYQVQTLAGRMDVEMISLYVKDNGDNINKTQRSSGVMFGTDILEEWRNSTGITKTKSVFKLSGAGVNIGIVEPFHITYSAELPSDRFVNISDGDGEINTDSQSVHEENVARLCAGTYGVAHGSTVYIASAPQYEYSTALEYLVQNNVNVINSSSGPDGVLGSYTAYELYVDYLINVHNVTFVQAGGNAVENNSTQIICPGLADNVITVGGYNNYFTDSTQDDQMYSFVYSENGGCAKPDVIAPANTPFNDAGTSYSAPFVAGSIALMFDLQPSLKTKPEVVKAIVLASCHRKVKPADNDSNEELIEDGITDKQGAGVFDPFIALSIVSHGTYGSITYPFQFPSVSVSFVQPQYNSSGLNISITWLRKYGIIPSTGAIASTNREDFDIELWQDYTKVGESWLNNSSTETIYCSLAGDEPFGYTLKIDRWYVNENDTRIGYAWSVSNTRNQYATNGEGFYLFRNAGSGYYLQANDDMTVTQGVLRADADQIWFMSRDSYPGLTWVMQNVAKRNNSFLFITATDNNYLAAMSNEGVHMMEWLNDSGQKFFLGIREDGYYALGVLGSSVNASATWDPITENQNSITSYQKWSKEQCAYQRGDVDMNGFIFASDARIILRGAVALESFLPAQQYLADVDGNGNISAADARLALRYSVGLFD